MPAAQGCDTAGLRFGKLQPVRGFHGLSVGTCAWNWSGEDHLVLNSVLNLAKAYRHLAMVNGSCNVTLTMMKPDGGRWKPWRTRYGGKVTDCSGLYGGCKDLNDDLKRHLPKGRHGGKTKRKGKKQRNKIIMIMDMNRLKDGIKKVKGK